MATSKTSKVEAEIEKTRAKISELTAKLKELEQRRTEIENSEIVDVVRGMSIPLDELAVLLQTLKNGGGTSGQNVHKSAPAEKEDN